MTVPVVAGLYYLKQTGTLTEQQRQSAHRFLSKGIEKVASYGCINTDGSFNPMYFPQPGLCVCCPSHVPGRAGCSRKFRSQQNSTNAGFSFETNPRWNRQFY
ncbi:hypothetical protein DPMN_069854 [Dreissena polymorpha]|uniref:Uncharacterized protein n=1 Tax=Dreissena polymorpha TaxID=45954 RepID=A0A9D3Z1Y8_DREPO|nr:hypothetical protein DPMN_069854 [Dreissena polymorpha]